MEESRREQYAAALRAKQAELLNGLNQREGLWAEPEPDVFDEMQRALDRALVIDTLDRNSALLREVRTALERLANGSYGQCLQCEEEINPKRLSAVPWAPFCLTCQEQADREERGLFTDAGDFLRAA
jgi:DnaK suppressor protein